MACLIIPVPIGIGAEQILRNPRESVGEGVNVFGKRRTVGSKAREREGLVLRCAACINGLHLIHLVRVVNQRLFGSVKRIHEIYLLMIVSRW